MLGIGEGEVVVGGQRRLAVSLPAGYDQSSAVDALTLIPSVIRVEPVPRYQTALRYAVNVTQDSNVATAPLSPFLTGDGETVAVGDSGVDVNSCFFDDADVPVVADTLLPTHRKIASYRVFPGGDGGDDDSGHGSHVAGIVAGLAEGANVAANVDAGMAPGARLVVLDIGMTGAADVGPPLDLYANYFPVAWDDGARISTNSWGSGQSDYSSHCEDVDRYVWDNPEFLILFSAGNDGDDGFGTVRAPGLSKNALCVGSQQSTLEANEARHMAVLSGYAPYFTEASVSGFSGRGPTYGTALGACWCVVGASFAWFAMDKER